MAIPSISDLKTWVGTLLTKDDWDFNFNKIVSWLSDGNSDIVVGSVRAENGLDMAGSKITNVGAATTGSDAVSYDQAQTLLNRTSYFYPYSIASGKVDANGLPNYLQKDSDTKVTVLAGNTNPDLVVIQSDGTVESVTTNTVVNVPTTNGTYNIVKEKGNTPVITSGVITVGADFPTSQNAGDYYLNNGIKPFVGYKYDAVEGWIETPFCHIGTVKVVSGVATITGLSYNDNKFDFNKGSIKTYINGSSGYIIYPNGLIEQWGKITSNTPTITLSVAYSNTNYNIQTSNTTAGSHYENGGTEVISKNSFKFNWGYSGCYWRTIGK